jgi:lysophospholipase L1-like esterase
MHVRIKDIMKGMLSFILAFGVMLLLTEIGLRIYTHYRISYDIEMSRYAMTLKMESDNVSIGHEHRPNSSAHLMGVLVEINSDGLRDKDYPIEKSSGVQRMAFLGDSLTFGWGVKSEETFAHLIEKKISQKHPTEVINFGTGNYNTQQELSLFRKKGLKYDFDQVTVFYFINDAEPTPRKSRYEFLGNIRTVSFFWSRITTAMGRLKESNSFSEYYRALYVDGQLGYEGMKAAFAELEELCTENDIGLKVVLLPELHNLLEYPFRKEYAKVSAHLDSLGIEHLDLTDAFAGERSPYKFWVAMDDAHPNAVAHKIIADHALPFLMDKAVASVAELDND